MEFVRLTIRSSVSGTEFGTEWYGTELIRLTVWSSVNGTEIGCDTEVGTERLRFGIYSVNDTEFDKRYGIRYGMVRHGTVRYGINTVSGADLG